jgi:uncharacterized membrane protein YqjE
MDTAAANRIPEQVPSSAFSAAPGLAGSAAPETAADLDAREASFLAPFERVFATLRRMASNYATLAVLDVRRAAVQFAWLVAGGILISVLVVTAWLAAVVALAVWLLGNGMSWPAVLLVAAGLNIVGAAVVGMRLRAVFQHVPFEATLRQIKSDDGKSDEKK